jgi:hypothetical protein
VRPRCDREPAVGRIAAPPGHTLPHGTARLVVYSTFVVQSIYGAIQEYADASRPEWLDLR